MGQEFRSVQFGREEVVTCRSCGHEFPQGELNEDGLCSEC